MAVVTSLLIRWAGGYREVVDAAGVAAWGRKEGFLQLGNISESDEVERIAAAVFAFQAAPRVATTMGIEPSTGSDEPYVAYDVADTITAPDDDGTPTAQRVVSVTVAEDDNGEVTYASELKHTLVVEEEAFNEQLKRLLSGSLKGASKSATPNPGPTYTKAENGNSVGALRSYVDDQLVRRTATAHTSSFSGIEGGTFDPATDQELEFAYTTVVTMGAGGFVQFNLPDGGFPNGLLMAQVTFGDVGGVGGYFVGNDNANCTRAHLKVLVVEATNTPFPNGGNCRLNVLARGW